MQKALRVLRWLLALATIAVIAALCWQAVDIDQLGTGAANRTNEGVLLQPIYRWEDVTARLTSLAPLLWGYAVFAAIMLLLHALAKPEKVQFTSKQSRKDVFQGRNAHRSASAGHAEAESARSQKTVQKARIALYALAIIMVVWGVMNGGLRDVLVKAINICTECIGLG